MLRGLALTLGTETAASPATHLRILRSSNHSSNKPYVVVNDTDNYLGGAPTWIQQNYVNGEQNCLGYILNLVEDIQPAPNTLGSSAVDYFDNYLKAYIEGLPDFTAATRYANLPTISLSSKQYRIAMRVASATTMSRFGLPAGPDYHFWVETSSGIWAHKKNEQTKNSRILDTDTPNDKNSEGWLIGSYYDWIEGETIYIHYDNPTIYIVVERS